MFLLSFAMEGAGAVTTCEYVESKQVAEHFWPKQRLSKDPYLNSPLNSRESLHARTRLGITIACRFDGLVCCKL